MSEFKLSLSETLAYATVALAELRRIQTILDRVFGEMNDQRHVSADERLSGSR